MNLTCCVCGNGAPAKRQWWNRDTGYGLCGRCAAWLKTRPDYNAEEFTSYYGEEGIHWMPELQPTHLLRTRGGSQCGATGKTDADINNVTCQACVIEHAAITGEP